MIKELRRDAAPGTPIAVVLMLLGIAAVVLLVWATIGERVRVAAGAGAGLAVVIYFFTGLFTVSPNQGRVLQLFEAIKSRGHRAGVLPAELDDARYALAAYLDEMIHYSDWPGKEEWAKSPLQAALFGESKAGARGASGTCPLGAQAHASTATANHAICDFIRGYR